MPRLKLLLLLAFLFAATDTKGVSGTGGFVGTIFTTAMANHLWGAKLVLIIATVGQLFCGAAGLTSASRTWYAFSRDRGMPGWWLFRRLNQARVPLYAVLAVSVASLARKASSGPLIALKVILRVKSAVNGSVPKIASTAASFSAL